MGLCRNLVKSILQGFLPGLSLKIFLAVLPTVVWYLAVFEGHVSYSRIEKHACINYLLFMLVNVFLGNVVTGSAFEQLKLFIETPTQYAATSSLLTCCTAQTLIEKCVVGFFCNNSAFEILFSYAHSVSLSDQMPYCSVPDYCCGRRIPSVLGKAIAQRAPFFITYVMVDGWTNTAAELCRVLPFILYHFKNATMVRTEWDRDRATPVGFIRYTVALPRLGLYFLLGFVYSTISPLILPFILVYLCAAYVVYRNQVSGSFAVRCLGRHH